MNLKKYMSILISLMLVISMAACSDDGDSAATPKTTVNTGVTSSTAAGTTATPEPTASPTPMPTRVPHSDENPYYGIIKSQDPVSVPFYVGDAPNANHIPEALQAETKIAWQFVATTDFDYIEVIMCTWQAPEGATTFSIYKWDADYDTTIAGEALYTKDVEKIADNATVKFTFDKPLTPDEYVFVLSGNLGTTIGIYKVPYTEDEPYDYARMYINDMEVTDYLPHASIHYVNTPEIKFLALSETE